MKHHLLKHTWHIEGDKIICSYCGSPVDLKPEHEHEKHYKSIKCKCGKTVVMTIPFHGTGHDDFIKSKLEKKVEEKE